MAQTSVKDFKPFPLPLSSITPLDFDEAHTDLPSSHAWPSSDIENYQVLESMSVPVIDVSDPSPKQLEKLRGACEKLGFFEIINHGVSRQLLDDLKTEMRGLFALPTKVKLQALRSPHETSGYGGVPIALFTPNKLWHEGFGIKNSLREHALKLWPSDGNPRFCQVMEEYRERMQELAEKVLILMLASVGLTPDDTNWAEPKTKENPFGPRGAHFHLNSYPPCPEPTQSMGLTQHTDSSIITLLNQVNEVSGLQMLHDEKWVNIGTGSFIVNVGDLAHILFNGRFVSPFHRVIPNRVGQRFTAAYFYGPPPTGFIAPLPKLVGPGCRPAFQPVTWEDFLNAKYQPTNKVFDFIRNDTAKEEVKEEVQG